MSVYYSKDVTEEQQARLETWEKTLNESKKGLEALSKKVAADAQSLLPDSFYLIQEHLVHYFRTRNSFGIPVHDEGVFCNYLAQECSIMNRIDNGISMPPATSDDVVRALKLGAEWGVYTLNEDTQHWHLT